MSTLAVVVLTLNEEKNLPKTLESVRGFATEVFVVDSFSQDRTLEIAKQFGAIVRQHSFETHAKQWNWALQNLKISTDWVLALDADQVVTKALSEEIVNVLSENSNVDGFFIKRQYVFRGRAIRFGGYGNKYLLKLFRNHQGECDERELLDFRFYVKSGKIEYLKAALIEKNTKDDDLNVWMAKHKRFSVVQAEEEIKFRRYQKPNWKLTPNAFGNPDEKVLFFKSVWYWLPRYVRPFLYFGFRYLICLGFLDGLNGLIFHSLQAFWYRWLVDCEIGKHQRNVR